MSSTLIISLFVFLPIIIFIVVIAVQQKKKARRKKSELLTVYKRIVLTDKLEITDEQIMYNKIFAADRHRKVFVFVHNREEPAYDIIHLNGLSACKVERTGLELTTTSDGKPKKELHVNELSISFLLGASVLASVKIYSEIYDGLQEYLHLKGITEQWQQKLDNIIGTRP